MKTKLRKALGLALLAASVVVAAAVAYKVIVYGLTPTLAAFGVGLAVFGLLLAAVELISRP